VKVMRRIGSGLQAVSAAELFMRCVSDKVSFDGRCDAGQDHRFGIARSYQLGKIKPLSGLRLAGTDQDVSPENRSAFGDRVTAEIDI